MKMIVMLFNCLSIYIYKALYNIIYYVIYISWNGVSCNEDDSHVVKLFVYIYIYKALYNIIYYVMFILCDIYIMEWSAVE